MNLKSGIKRCKRAANSGGYCLCFGALKYEAVLHRETGKIEAVPDVCPSRGRAVNKTYLEISFEQCLKNVEARWRQAATFALFAD